MGAFMLSDLCNPMKKKVIFRLIAKKAPNINSTHSILVNLKLRFFIKGKSITLAKKNLIKARVKGGIFSREYLKIGEAAPQMILAITKAVTPLIIVLILTS